MRKQAIRLVSGVEKLMQMKKKTAERNTMV
jgi:hypothetical protein